MSSVFERLLRADSFLLFYLPRESFGPAPESPVSLRQTLASGIPGPMSLQLLSGFLSSPDAQKLLLLHLQQLLGFLRKEKSVGRIHAGSIIVPRAE